MSSSQKTISNENLQALNNIITLLNGQLNVSKATKKFNIYKS